MSEKFENAVNSAKSWLKSRTVWGGLVSLVNATLIYFGADAGTDLEVITDTVFEGASTIAAYADSVYAIGVQAVAFAVTFWGRLKAKVPLSLFGKSIVGGGVVTNPTK